jgi:hypothetical protein
MSLDRLIESNVELQYPTSKPTYDLNFTRRTLKGIDPAYSFTRNSSATYVGPDGLIKTAAVNQPRFEFDVLSGDYRGLLIEESRANLVPNSDKPSLLPSTEGFGALISVSSVTTLTPKGNQSVWRFTVPSSWSQNPRRNIRFPVVNATVTYSCFMKGITNNAFVFFGAFNGSSSIGVNLSTGSIGFKQGFGHKVQYYGNGWWRVFTSGFANSSGSFGQNFGWQCDTANAQFYAFGVQIEVGSYGTSYITTSGSAVTRQPDQLILNKPLNTQGTLYVESRPTTGVPLVADNGSSSLSVPQETNQYSKSVLYYNTNRILRMSSDGGVPVDYSSSSSPSNLNRVSLGFDRLNNSSYINGHLKKFSYYSSPLTEDNLRALTGNKRSITRFTSFGEPIVTSGLVLNLDAGNLASYPGSGTTWTDLSGNGNNGTLVNGVGYSGDNLGSLSFDGVNDAVTGSITPLTSNYSIELWFKLITSNSSGNSLIALTVSNNHGFLGEIRNSDKKIRFLHRFPYGISGGNSFYSSGSINLNQIYCITWVRDTNQKIYINSNFDSQITSTNSAFDSNLNQLVIGQLVPNNSARIINGNIYSCKIYNKALTAAEIQQNFNATRNRFGI